MTKVYGIYGRSTAVVRVPSRSSKAWLVLEFKGGRHGNGTIERPATYVTSDVVEQDIIEASPYFGGSIKLVRSYDNGKEVAAGFATAKAAAAQSVPTSVPGVTTREEAIAYLKRKGAKATNLKDDESIKAYAERISVSFPNLTL